MVEAGEAALDLVEQQGSVGCRYEPAAPPVEQGKADRALHFRHQLADGGLGHVEKRRSAGRGAGLHNRPEALDMPKSELDRHASA